MPQAKAQRQRKTKAEARGGTYSESGLMYLANTAKRKGRTVMPALILDCLRRLHCNYCAVSITVPTDPIDGAPIYGHAYAIHEWMCDAP